jgi:putative N6-adenine-specific DNA methylase
MVAKTITGLEEVLARELEEIGAEDVKILKRAVSFNGDKRLMYKVNLWCRTALRILKPIRSFPLKNEADLYEQLQNIPWDEYMNVRQTLAMDAVVNDSLFTHSHFVALRSKDSVVDYFRNKFGRRPSVDTENPDLRINIHIQDNVCDVSLDSSGTSLHKRGYKQVQGEAPMSEVLAAGLILMSGWDKKSHFVDPMCGSGTLLMEAALIANNIPAGNYRQIFGFMNWPDYEPSLWEELQAETIDTQVEFEHRIIGCDISEKSIAISRRNLQFARLHKDIELFHSSFQDFTPPAGNGWLVTNPPYGERLQVKDIIGLYKDMGDTLKQKYGDFHAWIISADIANIKFIGLKPSKKYIVFNGQLECRFLNFELYRGSKKAT